MPVDENEDAVQAVIRASADAGVAIVKDGLLPELCRAVNRAIPYAGGKGLCVQASAVLRNVLRSLGYQADLMRVETAVFPDKCGPFIIGCAEDGEPGNWNGHLVAVTEECLLDATIGQVNQDGLALEPLVIAVPPWWFNGSRLVSISIADCLVMYTAYPDCFWKSAPFRLNHRLRGIVEALSQEFRRC